MVELERVGRPMKIMEKKGMLWSELLWELKTKRKISQRGCLRRRGVYSHLRAVCFLTPLFLRGPERLGDLAHVTQVLGGQAWGYSSCLFLPTEPGALSTRTSPRCHLQHTPLYLANTACLFISWLVWRLKFGLADVGCEEFTFFLFVSGCLTMFVSKKPTQTQK